MHERKRFSIQHLDNMEIIRIFAKTIKKNNLC